MAKKVFAVVLNAPESSVKRRLDSEYANVHQHTDTFLLVPVDVGVTAQEVAIAAGIKGKNRDIAGVVFKLNAAYSGYTTKTLWEWLSDVESA